MKKYVIDSILQRKLNNLVEKKQSLQRESKTLRDSLGSGFDVVSLKEELLSLKKELRPEYLPIRREGIDSEGRIVICYVSTSQWKKEQSELKNKISKISEKLAIAKQQRNLNLASKHLGKLIRQFKKELQTFDPASKEARHHLKLMTNAFQDHHAVLSVKRPRSSAAKFFDSLRPSRPTHTVELITDFLDHVKKLTETTSFKVTQPYLLFSPHEAKELRNQIYIVENGRGGQVSNN